MALNKRTPKRRLGDIGETIVCDFMRNRGFEVVDRNYLRKWGELDIVAKKGDKLHFVEVKSVSRGTLVRPEDNMHPRKLARLARAMQTYMLERKFSGKFQLDLAVVKIDRDSQEAEVEIMENIII